MKKSDVTELLRITEVYKEKEKPEKVELIIISPFIEEKAEDFAQQTGVMVYSETMK